MSAGWQAVCFFISMMLLLTAAIIAWLERARYSLVVALGWAVFVFVFFVNAINNL